MRREAACRAHQAIFNSAATQQPWGIQRAESLAELKICQEEQTGESPGLSLCSGGNHSLLHVDVVYQVTSILMA